MAPQQRRRVRVPAPHSAPRLRSRRQNPPAAASRGEGIPRRRRSAARAGWCVQRAGWREPPPVGVPGS
ncbi:hypothetical protein G6F68_020040 [Rhizopus microsporus]|nr:hypothetical protein G6F68_020040 [Rhizopus microsporus]